MKEPRVNIQIVLLVFSSENTSKVRASGFIQFQYVKKELGNYYSHP